MAAPWGTQNRRRKLNKKPQKTPQQQASISFVQILIEEMKPADENICTFSVQHSSSTGVPFNENKTRGKKGKQKQKQTKITTTKNIKKVSNALLAMTVITR